MEKIKDLAGRLVEKIFPDLPEKKRVRLTVQLIVGISITLACIAGMGFFRYRAVKQLEEMFLEFAKGDLKKQTHSRYYRAYVNYVKDSSFGKIPARKIKKYHCDDFIRTLTNGTIVYSYVCQIKCIVSQAFDYACDREIMSWNFMRKVKINEDRCKAHEDKELGVWEDDEINTLQSGSMNCWNKCRKYRNSPALFILCGTGLRLGELLALK